MDLDTSPYTDCTPTGMFYEALHWVEAFLATKGHHYREHKQRKWAMCCLFPSDLGTIEVDYSKLKQESETSRYECYKHTATEIRQLIPLINHIKYHISQLI